MFYHDYIKDKNSILNRKHNDLTTENILPPPPPIFSNNENHYFQQNDHLNSEQAILMSPSSSVFMMPPPPSKPKSSNGRKKVELTEIEKNEIRRIFNAGVEGLNKLSTKRIQSTWQKIFDDGLSLEYCLKRRLGQKKNRLRKKEYNARPEVKERSKEYRSKRKRSVSQLYPEIDLDEKKRPTKKRKV